MSQPDENENTSQNSTSESPPSQYSTSESPPSQYSTPQHSNPQYSGPQYSDPQYSGPPDSHGYPPRETPSTGYGGPGEYSAPSGYQAPGYPEPGQSAAAQPGPGYPPSGYPAPYGYPPYGYPMQRGPIRPGGATASAVLMFIQSAVTLISTFYVLFGASVAGSIAGSSASSSSLQTEWTVIGILQLVSVGLLIFGGVQLLGGNGRTLTILACATQLAFVIYWMIRIGTLADFDGSGIYFVVPLFYALLPLVALPLALGKAVGDYIAAKKGTSSTGS